LVDLPREEACGPLFLCPSAGHGYKLAQSFLSKLANMIRIVFWAVLIYLAFWAWRKFKAPPTRPAARPQPPADTATPMVRCAHCGVHLPQNRALSIDSEWYCTQVHLEEGPRPRAR
jgi:uncharacterized protein